MTAIITKNGTGVPPSEALQKGELAVDLDALKLYTSTNGTDVVEVSAAGEIPEYESPFDLDASGTATQKITLPEGALWGAGEEKDVGVGHLVERKDSDTSYTYYFKREGMENIHNNTAEDFYDYPFYWIVDERATFQWAGAATGSGFHSAQMSWVDDLEADTVIIGEAFVDNQGRRVSYSDIADQKAKFAEMRARHGFSVETRDREPVEVPLVVYGKIQADDLVDADGNTLLGGGDFEMPQVIDGGTY